MIRAGDGSLYTGVATDVERRLAEHRDGARGSKYLRRRGPLAIAYSIVVGDRGLALSIEHRLKRLPKADKEALLASEPGIDELRELLAV